MKMYIFIKEVVPPDFVPVVSAHASLACYLKFQDDPDMKQWLSTSFKKVICKINDEQFIELSKLDKHSITTESSLGGIDVAISFCPKVDSTMFKYYTKYYR
jgi:hypothetical protein